MRFRSPGNPVRENSDHLFLAYMSHNFRNAVHNGLAHRLKPLGVTPVQMAIILRCHTGDASTVTELGRIIPLSVALISRQVEHLVKLELISRKYPEDDRRVAHLCLTEKAENMIPDFLRHRSENEAALLAGVTEEEKQALVAIVEKILANYQRTQNRNGPTLAG